MKYELFSRIEGEKELHSEIEFTSHEEAKEYVEKIFNHINAWAFEDIIYGTGGKALTIKDFGNKIMYRLKTQI